MIERLEADFGAWTLVANWRKTQIVVDRTTREIAAIEAGNGRDDPLVQALAARRFQPHVRRLLDASSREFIIYELRIGLRLSELAALPGQVPEPIAAGIFQDQVDFLSLCSFATPAFLLSPQDVLVDVGGGTTFFPRMETEPDIGRHSMMTRAFASLARAMGHDGADWIYEGRKRRALASRASRTQRAAFVRACAPDIDDVLDLVEELRAA